MVTPVARAAGCGSPLFEFSQRRACEAIGADRSSVRYLSLRPDDATIRTGCVSWPRYAGALAIAVCFS
jgi:putative transposase